MTTAPEVPAAIRGLAHAAAASAGVRVVEVDDHVALRQACTLLERVWGRNADGVPISVEMLRSIAHADGAVTLAFPIDAAAADPSAPVGVAALILAGGTDTYSLIAAAAPGEANRGLGFALKQRQRVWALECGRTTMRWTFDPLMARNARFNLAKLGVEIAAYVPSFYGPMDDDINAGDEGDRLVARWQLATAGMPVRGNEVGVAAGGSDRMPLRSNGIGDAAAASGDLIGPPAGAESPEPDLTGASVRAVGPDGEAAYLLGAGEAWCRVPVDVAALRRSDHDQAREWRAATREHFTDALGRGLVVRSFTRSGWYHLVAKGPR